MNGTQVKDDSNSCLISFPPMYLIIRFSKETNYLSLIKLSLMGRRVVLKLPRIKDIL